MENGAVLATMRSMMSNVNVVAMITGKDGEVLPARCDYRPVPIPYIEHGDDLMSDNQE